MQQYNIASTPLYYVRSGYVAIKHGYVDFAGNNGYGWSSRGNDSDNARFLYFYASSTYPSYNGNRYNGVPLRCLSTV